LAGGVSGKRQWAAGAGQLTASAARPHHSFTFRSRKALPITDTELRLIAAPATIGLSRIAKNG
jgi:hypothetical protein